MNWIIWLRRKPNRIYYLSFILMLISSALIYPIAQTGLTDGVLLLVGTFIFANILVIWAK